MTSKDKEVLINTAASVAVALDGFPIGQAVECVSGEIFVTTRYELVARVEGFGGRPGVHVYGHSVKHSRNPHQQDKP